MCVYVYIILGIAVVELSILAARKAGSATMIFIVEDALVEETVVQPYPVEKKVSVQSLGKI